MKRYTLLFFVGLFLIPGNMKGQSSVDTRIAVNSTTDANTFAVIICNENYKE